MIRKYQEKDLEPLLDVWYAASLIAHSFMPDAFFEQERENIRDIYMPVADTWVYEEAGRAVGFISLVENEVGGIFVYPDWQGKGIGRALMDKAKAIHGTLELEVFKKNLKARGFYERYGFVSFKEFPDPETGNMVIRMRSEK